MLDLTLVRYQTCGTLRRYIVNGQNIVKLIENLRCAAKSEQLSENEFENWRGEFLKLNDQFFSQIVTNSIDRSY